MNKILNLLLIFCCSHVLKSQIESPNLQFIVEEGYQHFRFNNQSYYHEVDSSGNLRFVPNSTSNLQFLTLNDDGGVDIEIWDKSKNYIAEGSNEDRSTFDLNLQPDMRLDGTELRFKVPNEFDIIDIYANTFLAEADYGEPYMGVKMSSLQQISTDHYERDLEIYNDMNAVAATAEGGFMRIGGDLRLSTRDGSIILQPESQLLVPGVIQLNGVVDFNDDINSDIIPRITSHDLGNDNNAEHWDNVVADNFITRSDSRMKKNINAVTSALKDVMNLNPVKYQYTEKHSANDKVRHGFIAQEVQKILPELVVTEDVDIDESGKLTRIPNEYLSLNYLEFIPLLTKAIQEQQEIINSQSKLIAALSTQNAAILRRLDQLEK